MGVNWIYANCRHCVSFSNNFIFTFVKYFLPERFWRIGTSDSREKALLCMTHATTIQDRAR